MPVSSTASVSITAIPRPTAKRQLSQPTTSTSTPINLSANLFNITKLPRMCTNPFLNGTLDGGGSSSGEANGKSTAIVETTETPKTSIGSLEVTDERQEICSSDVDVSETSPETQIIQTLNIRQSLSSSCNLNNPFIVNSNDAKTNDQNDAILKLEGNEAASHVVGSYDLMTECEKLYRKNSFDLNLSKNSHEYKMNRKKSRKSDGEIFIDLTSPPIANLAFTSIQELPLASQSHTITSLSTASTHQSPSAPNSPQSTNQQELDDVFLENTNSNMQNYQQSSTRFYNILSKLNDDALATSSTPLLIQSSTNIQQQTRTRSLSETEFLDSHHRITGSDFGMQSSSSANPFINTKLHKTLSENFLEQYNSLKSGMKNGNYGTSGVAVGSFNGGKTAQLSRDGSIKSLGSNCSMESIDENIIAAQQVQRAVSCESVTSQSSILASDLFVPTPTITGYLCIGLQYDKYVLNVLIIIKHYFTMHNFYTYSFLFNRNSITETGQDLIVTVLEAKELIGSSDCDPMNTFVRIYIVPDETGAMQTKVRINARFHECLVSIKKRTFSDKTQFLHID